MSDLPFPSVQNPRINPGAFSNNVGVETEPDRFGVIGSTVTPDAFGFLAGKDLTFGQAAGVYGESAQQGVMGIATSASGTGVYGGGGKGGGGGIGVRGETLTGVGVMGRSFGGGTGVLGRSEQEDGVRGESNSDQHAGVSAINNGKGFGLFVLSRGGGPAGHFEGNIEVTGDIAAQDVSVTGNVTAHDVNVTGNLMAHDVLLTAGADCAEDFDVVTGAEPIEPGTVMVINQEGVLQPSQQAYDKRVAGVISGAGGYKPGITLDKQPFQSDRLPIALLGKAYCKVDARYAAVEVGDLLTTSPTPGHAMKAADRYQAFGTVIGKALRPLPAGQGLVPILIALQ